MSLLVATHAILIGSAWEWPGGDLGSVSSLVSAVRRGELGIASALWSLDHSKGVLGQRGAGLGLPFLCDTEARDMAAQRPGKVCAVKPLMSERHEADKAGSIQPRSVLSAGGIGFLFFCQGKGPKKSTPEKPKGQCLTYHPQGAIVPQQHRCRDMGRCEGAETQLAAGMAITWLGRGFSSLGCSQWSAEHAGSAEDAAALSSPPSSGCRAALGCDIGHGGMLCPPQTALHLC